MNVTDLSIKSCCWWYEHQKIYKIWQSSKPPSGFVITEKLWPIESADRADGELWSSYSHSTIDDHSYIRKHPILEVHSQSKRNREGRYFCYHVKEALLFIPNILTGMFNRLLSNSVFSYCWKSAKVTPYFKVAHWTTLPTIGLFQYSWCHPKSLRKTYQLTFAI